MKQKLLLLLVSMLPVVANAYDAKIDGIYYNFSGDKAIVTYQETKKAIYRSDYSGSVVIPESVTFNGKTYTVTYIYHDAFNGCSGLTSVTIPNSVTAIGLSAFHGCSSLTSVTIPKDVTIIAQTVFSGCSGLTSIIIPESVTSIDTGAFNGCSGLTSFTIPNSVISIGSYAFYNCYGLTSVTIPKSVTSIGDSSFRGCDVLTSVTVGMRTPVTIGETTFTNRTNAILYVPAGCKAAYEAANYWREFKKIVEIADKTERIQFADATVKALCVANWDIDNDSELSEAEAAAVTSLGSVFRKKKEITSFNELRFFTGLTSIGDEAFFDCSGLTSVTIPNSVTSIGNYAFYGCSSLTSVTIPNSVTTIGNYAFHECSGLTSVTIPESVTSIGDEAFFDCSGLTSVTIPNSVTSIGNYAFYGCSGLTSITIPNSVTTIGNYAFYNCSGLTSVTIPESVTSIGNCAFYGCSGLTSVTIPNSVTSIGDYAFYGCSGLTSITIPNSVTSIGNEAFRNCNGLTFVSIGNGVTSVGYYVFVNCTKIESVTFNSNAFVSKNYDSNRSLKDEFGEQVKEYVLGNDVLSIGDYAFYNCKGLSSVTIGKGVTRIGEKSFYNCSGLEKVIVPDIAAWCLISFKDRFSNPLFWAQHLYSDETTEITDLVIPNSVTSIGYSAFTNCKGLKSVTFGNGVTSIGISAFSDCSGLTSPITIPSNVTSIGYEAFEGCSGLTSIIISSSVTSIGSDAINGCHGLKLLVFFKDYNINIPTNTCSVIVPSSLYGTYKSKYKATIHTMDRMNPTQTTITVEEAYPEYFRLQSMTLGDNEVEANDGTAKISELSPNKTYPLIITGKDTFGNTVSWTNSVTTKGINIGIMKEKEITNTTMTIGKPSYDAGDAKVQSAEFVGYGDMDEIHITGLKLGEYKSITYRVITSDGSTFNNTSSLHTKMVKANVTSKVNSASSATLKGSLSDLIDATIDKIGFEENGYTSNEIQLTGLNPNTSYTKRFKATFKEGGEAYKDITFRTSTLTLEAQQPKVISEGNVIVAAKTNIDDKELNIGFEWRRTDWTNDFDSKTGSAYLYNGEMEGYIRSLNPNYLWKFRPYYVANDGTYYYGEWKGMDPSDYSYFEPTVHTYATINVQGNTAEVKGYAMRGTDNVVSQGFMYWESNTSVSLRKRAASVPNGAKVVNASGNVMTATLEDLEYETTYKYVAFVTTSEGETFYGEMQTFSTSADPDGIEEIKASKDAVEVARYDIHGRKIAKPQKGINIIRYSDGSTRKVMVK